MHRTFQAVNKSVSVIDSWWAAAHLDPRVFLFLRGWTPCQALLWVRHTVALKAFSAWPSALPPAYAPTHHCLLILSDSHLGSGSKAVTANGSWLARWWRIGMISLLSVSPATLPSCVALSLHTHVHKPKLERVLSARLRRHLYQINQRSPRL